MKILGFLLWSWIGPPERVSSDRCPSPSDNGHCFRLANCFAFSLSAGQHCPGIRMTLQIPKGSIKPPLQRIRDPISFHVCSQHDQPGTVCLLPAIHTGKDLSLCIEENSCCQCQQYVYHRIKLCDPEQKRTGHKTRTRCRPESGKRRIPFTKTYADHCII